MHSCRSSCSRADMTPHDIDADQSDVTEQAGGVGSGTVHTTHHILSSSFTPLRSSRQQAAATDLDLGAAAITLQGHRPPRRSAPPRRMRSSSQSRTSRSGPPRFLTEATITDEEYQERKEPMTERSLWYRGPVPSPPPRAHVKEEQASPLHRRANAWCVQGPQGGGTPGDREDAWALPPLPRWPRWWQLLLVAEHLADRGQVSQGGDAAGTAQCRVPLGVREIRQGVGLGPHGPQPRGGLGTGHSMKVTFS